MEADANGDKARAFNVHMDRILDATVDGFALVGGDQRLLDANRAYCRMVGYTREELLGLSVQDIDTQTAAANRERSQRILQGESIRFETKHRTKAGDVIDVEVSTTTLDSENGPVIACLLRDITERKRTEEALLLTQHAISTAPTGISWIAPDGRFLYVNDCLSQLLGYTADEVLSMTVSDIDAAVSPERWKEFWKEIKEQRLAEFESVALCKDGRTNPVGISANYISLGDREFVFASILDITERKRSEEVLRESEFKYRSLVEAFPDIVFITDYSGRMLYANPSLERQTGFTANDFQFSQDENAFIHSEDAPKVAKFIRDFASSEEQVSTAIENRLADKMGRSHWYSSVIAKVEYQGQPALQYIVRDITAQKETRESLRLSEDKFSKAFFASPDPIAITSRATHEFIDVNEGFVALSGYSREETIGKTSIDLGFYADLDDRERFFEALKRGERIRQWEVTYKTRAGKRLNCDVSVDLIDVQGEPAILTVVRDITERKRAEQERERAFQEIARLKDELERERDYLREEFNVAHRFGEIVGSSAGIKQVLARVEAVSSTGASVLIVGESGVGKELIARAIHSQSPRRSSPLVKVNCASIPRELFESEFFGHVKGAFTGAHRDRFGRFQLAHRGTLFLDEVAEIPMELQGKLLRVLQEGEYERVGEDVTRDVDVRVIAATNRNLRAEVESGRFREDLYYRLSVFPIEVPPLRERQRDIIPLATHLLKRACQDLDRKPMALTRPQAEILQAYDWPGNIRELHNVIERSVILSKGERLRLDLTMPSTASGVDSRVSDETDQAKPSFVTADQFRRRERENIIAALEQANWKVSGPGGAAELLGIKPTTLTYQIKVMGIKKPA